MPFLALGIVSAGVLGYYALFSVTLDVNQPISVNGVLGDIVDDIPDAVAGETRLGEPIVLSNDADSSREILVTTNSDDGIDVNYIGRLELTTKDTTTWNATNTKAVIDYMVIGDEFSYEVVSSDIDLEDYTLIYYKDNEVNSNDADRLTTIGSNEGITANFPHSDDWNVGEDANYCDNGFDEYNNCKGAKLWFVKTSDINPETNELSWANWNDYLYETDLVQYNLEGNLVIYGNSEFTITPVYELDKLLDNGSYDVTITIA